MCSKKGECGDSTTPAGHYADDDYMYGNYNTLPMKVILIFRCGLPEELLMSRAYTEFTFLRNE